MPVQAPPLFRPLEQVREAPEVQHLIQWYAAVGSIAVLLMRKDLEVELQARDALFLQERRERGHTQGLRRVHCNPAGRIHDQDPMRSQNSVRSPLYLFCFSGCQGESAGAVVPPADGAAAPGGRLAIELMARVNSVALTVTGSPMSSGRL